MAPGSLLLLFCALSFAQEAQFTVQDALDLRTVTLGDLSHDGRRLVAVTNSVRGRIGIDNSRFGDPTYVPPQITEIAVIDTRTRAAEKIDTRGREIRSIKWSPD